MNVARPGRAWIRVAVAALLAASAAARAAPVDARWEMPREEILARVHVIGMMPTRVASDVPDPDAVAARLESAIATRLVAAGFGVVAAEEMRPIQRRAADALGGLYDVRSGQPYRERLSAFREYIVNEYLQSHRVDAFLSADVVVRTAPVANGFATWDGVRDTVTGKAGVSGFFAGFAASGTTRALSLNVRVSDLDGRALYEVAGGLQPLEFVRASVTRGYVSSPLDPSAIMQDRARDDRAIAIALAPLTPAGAPATAMAAIPVPEPAQSASRKELLAHHRRLLLTPVEFRADIPPDEAARERYSKQLEARLRAIGFEVTVADDYAERWSEERERRGGFYDALTGRFDRPRFAAAQAEVLSRLGGTPQVDGIVTPTIERRQATFAAGSAHWDGATEFIGQSAIDWSIFGASRFTGSLGALSISVRITGLDSRLLFEGLGGIQLLEKLHGIDGMPVPVPSPLGEPAAGARAIDVALRPLEAPPPPSR